MMRIASSWSLLPQAPNIIVPRQSFETWTPVRPRGRVLHEISFGGCPSRMLYLPIEDPELDFTPLLTERRVVVLPESHRLAGRSELRPEDLRDEVLIEQPASVRRPGAPRTAARRTRTWPELTAGGLSSSKLRDVRSWTVWPATFPVPSYGRRRWAPLARSDATDGRATGGT
jgi:LysR substrate binding domain